LIGAITTLDWTGRLLMQFRPRSIGTDFGPLFGHLAGGIFRVNAGQHPLTVVPAPESWGEELMLQLNELGMGMTGQGIRKGLRMAVDASVFVRSTEVPCSVVWESVMEPDPAPAQSWQARMSSGPLRGVQADGRADLSAASPAVPLSVELSVPTLEITPQLRRFLPVHAPPWMEQIDLSGALTGRASMDRDGKGRLAYSARLETFGLNATSPSLPVSLRGVSAQLYLDQNRIQCRSLVGRSWDGLLRGNGVLTWGEGAEPDCFDARLTVERASLARMVGTDADAGKESSQLAGGVDFSIDAKGDPSDLRSITGRGEVELKEGRIAQLPLLAGLLNILKLSMPTRGVFDQGRARFRLREGKVHIRELHLASEVIEITGKGTIDINGDVRLVLAASTSQRKGKGIPLLSDAISLVVRGIQQSILPPVLVKGKIWEPKYKVLALEPIKTPLRSITGLIPLLPSPEKAEEAVE
jgi:hypothetical protein